MATTDKAADETDKAAHESADGTAVDDRTAGDADATTTRPVDSDEEQDVLIHLDPPTETTTRLRQDLVRGAVGGLVAGAVFIGLAAWFSAAAGGGPFDVFRQVATMGLGDPVEAGRGALLTGAAIHVGFALLAGLLFALAAPFLRRHGALVGAGVAYGGALYLIDLLAFGQEAYPLFQEASPAFDLTAFLLFGALLGASFAGIRLPGELHRNIVGQRAARAVGSLSAAAVVFLHLALADQYVADDRYVGAVVVAAAIAMAYVAIQLARRADLTAWIIGVLVSAGLITAYVLARTTGVPSVSDTGGGLPGLVAVVAEGVFLVAFVAALVGRRRNRTRIRTVPRRRPTRADMSAKEATTER